LFGSRSEKLSRQLDHLELQLEEMETSHAALLSGQYRWFLARAVPLREEEDGHPP